MGLIKQKVLAQPVKYTNRVVAAFTTVKYRKSTATLALTSSRAPGCCKSNPKNFTFRGVIQVLVKGLGSEVQVQGYGLGLVVAAA